MAGKESPYVNHCTSCGDGLLRLYRCEGCGSIVAICDECELMWSDVPAVSRSAKTPADAAFPECRTCHLDEATWSPLDAEDIRQANLEDCIAGRSE
jgi:hypothetical protein